MYNRIPCQKLLVKLLLATFVFVNFNQISYAGTVSTDAILDGQLVLSKKQQIMTELSNLAVQSRLESLGVDPELAKQRVQAMTDDEIQLMTSQLDELPAGGDFLGTAVFVFLVLLATDILGYTDIFPFVKKTVR